MKRRTTAHLLASLLLLSWTLLVPGCTPEEPELTALDQLVDDYEEGRIARADFLQAIAAMEDDGQPGLLEGRLDRTRLLFARTEPYRVESDFEVAAHAILVIEAGAALEIADTVSVDVKGRLYAVAPQDERIAIYAPVGQRYGDLFLSGGPNQLVSVDLARGERNLHVRHGFDTHTLVEDANFDSWVDLAIAQNSSSGLHVIGSRFGYDTPETEVSGETIRTRSSGSIIIEGSTFNYRTGYRDVLDLQDCDPERWPIVIGNRFDGGEDDAIDLDNCSAIVIGNHIRNYQPRDLTVQVAGVNGGGVTGDGPGTTPFIANNIIEGCFHGIGFKNGARPAIVHNTIIDSNIGITLYQSVQGNPMPDAVIYNNLLANNIGWLDGAENDIVLNGKWWPSYNQIDDVQATADVRFNTTATLTAPYPGDGNTNADPLIDTSSGLPRLQAGSPALDSGLEDLVFPDVAHDLAMEYLQSDFNGAPRDSDGQRLIAPDHGALENE